MPASVPVHGCEGQPKSHFPQQRAASSRNWRACSARACSAHESTDLCGLQLRGNHSVTRRELLAGTSLAGASLGAGLGSQNSALASAVTSDARSRSELQLPDYTKAGPLRPMHGPRIEHTCTVCYPGCATNACMLRIDVWYPKGGSAVGLNPPYPLAVFSSGFLVSAESYRSYARMLASWGYTTILYDKTESAWNNIDDNTSASFVSEMIDWAAKDPLMQRVADTSSVYLLGHSRGAKVAALAAAADERVRCLCLIDPVDNTVYAPLGPGFPSAAEALRQVPQARSLPIAIVGALRSAANPTGGFESTDSAYIPAGAALGGDCVPAAANYERFFLASNTAWSVVVSNAGHFQFLDSQTMLQQAVCTQGSASDVAVRGVAQAIAVAWGGVMMPAGSALQALGDNDSSSVMTPVAQASKCQAPRLGIDSEGSWRAGSVPCSTAYTLQQTCSQLQMLLGASAGSAGKARAPVTLAMQTRNIDVDLQGVR